MTNLIQNALQAIPVIANQNSVELNSNRRLSEVQIKDNGTGIAEEDIPKVFEPKFTTKTTGMGLGLAIVKNIIDSQRDHRLSFYTKRRNSFLYSTLQNKTA